MMPELHRPIATDRIGVHGLELEISANPDELAALAARMQLPGIGELRCRFQLRRAGGSVIAAEGRLRARLTQVCVVTLDEFERELSEEFVVHFVPAGEEDEDPDPDAVDEVPYTGNAIDLGEAAAEQLALALDPYPRKPGAELADPDEADAANPFAALASRRPV